MSQSFDIFVRYCEAEMSQESLKGALKNKGVTQKFLVHRYE